MIVYVEDDEDDVFLLNAAFRDIGIKHRLKVYKSGLMLLQELHTTYGTTCLFILDMNMPGINGLELIGQLQKSLELKGVPIAVLSTGITYEQRKACQTLGIPSFKKPLTVEELMLVVKEIMRLTAECNV